MNDKFNIKLQTLESAKALLFGKDVKLSERIRAKKEQFLLKIPLLALIHQKKGTQNFQTIIEHSRLVQTSFGEIVFNSQENRTFNIILRGTVMLFTKDKKQDEPKFYKKLGIGQYFGQKFHYGKLELESARSSSQSYLLQMDMKPFYHAFAGHFQYQQLMERVELLKRIWVFSNIKSGLLQRILLKSQSKHYVRGHILFREGDQADHLLAIISGQVTLSTVKDGKLKQFSILSEFQACGVEEILEGQPYTCIGICTSDYTDILHIDKSIVFQIFEREILPQTIESRKRLSTELKQKQVTKNIHMRTKSSMQEKTSEERRRSSLDNRKLKTESVDEYQPINKMDVLNSLFQREVQLKYPNLRPIRQQFIKNSQKDTYYGTNRISSYTNKECTYDKEIILSYLQRKEKRYRHALNKELQFQTEKIVLIPQLKVNRSLAVKNQKRKLKNSRKSHYSSVQCI